MTAADLLDHLRSLGVRLRVENENLRIEAVSGTVSPELRQGLADHKQSLISLLQAEIEPPLVKRPPSESIPLSHFQERLWIVQRLSPKSTEYNLVTAWPMGSEYPADRFVSAIRDLCQCHAVLRTLFFETATGLAGREASADEVQIDRFDLGDVPIEEQHERIMAEIDRHTAQPFDLAKEPPIRFGVFDLGPAGVAVLVAAHHIAMDHWSLSLLRAELTDALTNTRFLDKADSLQYADFADWSRVLLDNSRVNAHIDWWADRLKGSPDLCAFASDRAPELNGQGDSVSFSWDPELTARIQAFALANNATIYMCLVAACAVAIHAHTGQKDIVLGNPVAVRDRPELEQIIGPFVNTEVLRLPVDGDMSFRAVLAGARETILDSNPHSHVPFEMVVDRLQPARSLNRSPLFQVAVVMQNAGGGQSQPIYGGGAVHDMTWFTMMREDQLVGSIEYRSDIFHKPSVQRILDRLELILRSVTQDPDQAVSDIPLLSDKEEKQLKFWSLGPQTDSDAPLVTASLQQIAQATPERIAVVFEGQSVSYGDFNARANRIAHQLATLEIGSGSVVGLCMDRSPDMLAAQIGILKSGAAFVPIDPRFPAERVEYLASDSGAAAILMDAETAEDLDLDSGAAIVIVDGSDPSHAALPARNPETLPNRGDCAQLIYTSGSTGAPKGVQITHHALANLFASLRREPGVAPQDIVAATTTVSFDISSVELLLPLTVGAQINLLSREVATDGYALSEALVETGATVVQATPSAWRLLLEADWPGGPHVLAITGGEPLTRDLADALLNRVGRLWNGYGPTETTIYSTGTFIAPDAAAVSIGRPVDNTQLFVLAQNGSLAPVGLQGEICIGGEGVAIGYFEREELTAEKFIPNPFGKGRLYRTGDLGQWSDDGRLFHLGRSDHQVKIRGVRVELGEIEAALLQIPGIQDALALVHDAGLDDQRLVAYVVYEPGHDLMGSEVRHDLRTHLPVYMVPSLIVDLPKLPMTPNGKLDRKALPNPYAGLTEQPEQEPPSPGMETTLAEIWCDVLQVPTVGALENFFEIGGHSLLTLRVARNVQSQIGVELDPRVMFFKNLRQIAKQLSLET